MQPDATVLSFLAGVTVRSLVVMAIAGAALLLFRMKAPAARHAVWTVTVAGMLLVAMIAPLMPPLPVRVLHQEAVYSGPLPEAAEEVATATGPAAIVQAPPPSGVPWQRIAVGVYLAGAVWFLFRLAFGCFFTTRLVRSARPARRGLAGFSESSWTAVPLTVGWLRPHIILPEDWREWESEKLRAVLVHEQQHVRRGDWAVALLARVNRCLFWFHPGAWWLERELAALAEQACDDAALLELGGRDCYARALLDMAAAVKRGGGRLVWEAMAMAKASEVRMRIERILDETRQISGGLSRLRWAALVSCGLPLIYMASVAQLAPALAQEAPRAKASAPAGQPDFAQMEQYVASHPEELEARSRLIRDYFLYSIKQPRLRHIDWMIENHPESDLTALNSTGILPRASAMNDESDFLTAANLWRQAVSVHGGNAHVLANAARFFAQPGADPFESDRLLKAARAIEPNNSAYTQQLARLYATAILTNANPAFAASARSELEASNDGSLLSYAGSQLTTVVRNSTDPAARLQLKDVADLGDRLVARAQSNRRPLPAAAIVRTAQPPAPGAAQPHVSEPATVLHVVPPEYPPMARTARIEGTVQLMATFGPDGRVTDATVVDGPAALASAAVDAVKQWTFAPVMQNGVAITGHAPVSVPFHLDDMAAPQQGPAAQSATPSPTPQRIRVGGNVQSAKLITKVNPVYPQAARDANIQGTVQMQVLISKDGRVSGVETVDGNPVLAAAAQEAVMQWIYSPTYLNNNPVEVVTTVSLSFE